LAVKLLARDLFEGGHGHGVGKHVDLGALAVELLGRDLVGDVGEEHVDLVKLLARVLVEGGHGHDGLLDSRARPCRRRSRRR